MHKTTVFAAVVFSVLGAACSVAMAEGSDLTFGYAPVQLGHDGQEDRVLNGIGFGVSQKPSAVALRGGFFLASTPQTPQTVVLGVGFGAIGPSLGFHAGIGTQWSAGPNRQTQQGNSARFASADITLRF